MPDAESHTNRIARGYGEPVPVATWTSSDADVVVRCVCPNCNNGWMNALDHDAEPIVNEMCRGKNCVRVVDGALPVFGAWAVKMAFVMESLLTPSVWRQEDRERFYRERTPPPGFIVWVATMEGYEEETRTTPLALVPGPEPGTREQGCLVTFRMLHLVVQVLGPMHPNVLPERDAAADNVVQLAWPRVEPLEWPLLPKERWLRSEADYVVLTRSFRRGQIADG